jgi:hypothetical protein
MVFMILYTDLIAKSCPRSMPFPNLAARVSAAERDAITPNSKRKTEVELCAVLEIALEELYKPIFPRLTSVEKRAMINVEVSLTNKNPIDKLGLGGWVKYYKEGHIDEILERKFDLPRIDLARLEALVLIRNRATHDDYEPSKEEYDNVVTAVKEFLLSMKLVTEFPSIFPGTTIAKNPDPDLNELCRRIRLALATDPDFSNNDGIISDLYDDTVMYSVFFVCEFQGAHVDGKILVIELYEESSLFSDKVADRVYGEVSEKLMKKLEPFREELAKVEWKVLIRGNSEFELG